MRDTETIKEAEQISGESYSIDTGRPRYIKHKIFTDEEIIPAETIVSALEGMTIESAEMILDKVKDFLKQTPIPKMETWQF